MRDFEAPLVGLRLAAPEPVIRFTEIVADSAERADRLITAVLAGRDVAPHEWTEAMRFYADNRNELRRRCRALLDDDAFWRSARRERASRYCRRRSLEGPLREREPPRVPDGIRTLAPMRRNSLLTCGDATLGARTYHYLHHPSPLMRAPR